MNLARFSSRVRWRSVFELRVKQKSTKPKPKQRESDKQLGKATGLLALLSGNTFCRDCDGNHIVVWSGAWTSIYLGDGSAGARIAVGRVTEGTHIAGDGGNAGTKIAEGDGNAGTNIAKGAGNAGTNIAEDDGKAGTNIAEDDGNAGTNIAEGDGNFWDLSIFLGMMAMMGPNLLRVMAMLGQT